MAEILHWIDTNLVIAHPHERDYRFFLNYATPIAPIVATVAYLFMVFTLPSLLKQLKVKPIQLKGLVAFWNLLLSVFSFVVLVGVGVPYSRLWASEDMLDVFCGSGAGWKHLFSAGNPNGMLFWAYMFALSKYAELFDTLFLILRQKPVNFLHWFHHATVLLYTWFAEYTHLSLGFVFIVVNAFVHTFMYFYYFLSEIGHRPPEIVALLITIIQITQMVIGIASIVINAYVWYATGALCMCDYPQAMMIAGVAMYGSYLFLFLQFFWRRYISKPTRPQNTRSPANKNVSSPAQKSNSKNARAKKAD